MLFETRDRLTTIGLAPYEISNFATQGESCRHNLNYWTGGNYIGLGPSAASHVDGLRWKNRPIWVNGNRRSSPTRSLQPTSKRSPRASVQASWQC